MKSAKRRRGFLLLEVMVAIVVITGGLLFVMRVYSTSKLALDRSRELFKYSLLLEEKIFDFEERGVIEEGKERDHFPDNKECFWEAAAEPLQPQSQELGGLCSVKLDIDKYYLWTYLEKKR